MRVVALAGRRIDPPQAHPPRFPLVNVEQVRRGVRDMLTCERVEAMVSSASNGADLIGLTEAGRLGVRRRVVLPFEPARFRETSVVDRPGDWGPAFDRVIAEISSRGDLVTLDDEMTRDRDAYLAVTHRILDEAIELAGAVGDVLAVLVWNGASYGEEDLTAAFGKAAEARNLRVMPIGTT